MKVPDYDELMEFERAHFSPVDRILFNDDARELPKADRMSMDDSTLSAEDYT